MNKMKSQKKSNSVKVMPYDLCQTPSYGVDPLLKYVAKTMKIWECAAGGGMILKYLKECGYDAFGTDIISGREFSFLTIDWTKLNFDVIVTNPPYSIKYAFIKRCYEIGKPFALLMPLETLGSLKAQEMFNKYGMDLILLGRRVDFCMPNKGFDGKGAQFPVAWFTNGLNMQQSITYESIVKKKLSGMTNQLNFLIN